MPHISEILQYLPFSVNSLFFFSYLNLFERRVGVDNQHHTVVWVYNINTRKMFDDCTNARRRGRRAPCFQIPVPHIQ